MTEAPFALVPRHPTTARGELSPIRLRDADLVTAMQADAAELLLAKTRVAGAERLLSVVSRFLPCRAGVVRHGPLVVAARGDAVDLVMARGPVDAPILEGETLVLRIGGRASLELCDPLDGLPFESIDRAALRLLGARYTTVLDALGLVTDAAEIARHTLDA